MRRVLACALALLLVPAVSCGGGANQLCTEICDCEGCSDKEVEDCNEAADELEDDVGKAECSAELNDFTACLLDNAKCEDDDNYVVEVGDCDDELDDLVDCCDDDCDLGEFF